MAEKFTDGWWESRGNCIVSDFGEVGIAIVEPLEDFWCGDVCRLPTGKEMEANLRVLTASLRLLKACEDALVWFDEWMPEESNDTIDDLRAAVKYAREGGT